MSLKGKVKELLWGKEPSPTIEAILNTEDVTTLLRALIQEQNDGIIAITLNKGKITGLHIIGCSKEEGIHILDQAHFRLQCRELSVRD